MSQQLWRFHLRQFPLAILRYRLVYLESVTNFDSFPSEKKKRKDGALEEVPNSSTISPQTKQKWIETGALQKQSGIPGTGISTTTSYGIGRQRVDGMDGKWEWGQ